LLISLFTLDFDEENQVKSLESQRIAGILAPPNRWARHGCIVFPRQLRGVVGAMPHGKWSKNADKPWPKDAYNSTDHEQGWVLHQLVRARYARHIVQFDAAFDISATYPAVATRDDRGGTPITSEIAPRKILRAGTNWPEAGLAGECQPPKGDALETLRDTDGATDPLFSDSWNRASLPILRLLGSLLLRGACILCEYQEVVYKMRSLYIEYTLGNSDRSTSVELPPGEGLEVSVVV
jgi:predicted O-methyltransferase YrrM